MTTQIDIADAMRVLQDSGLPFDATPQGVVDLIAAYKQLHAKAVEAQLVQVNLDMQQKSDPADWQEFTSWLRQQADKHEANAWGRAKEVAQHVDWLRNWANTVEKIKPSVK